MKITKEDKNEIDSIIVQYLALNSSATRKDTINATLTNYVNSNNSKNSIPKIAINSYIGNAFNELVKKGEIVKNGSKYALNNKNYEITINSKLCETKILEFLKSRPYAKKELYKNLQKEFNTTKNKKLDTNLKQIAGQLLTKLIQNKSITIKNKKYVFIEQTNDPNPNDQKYENKLLDLLKKKSYSKKELYKEFCIYFNLKNDKAKNLFNSIFNKLVANKDIEFKNKKYTLNTKNDIREYNNTPISLEEFEKIFLARLFDYGGKHFENFVANLLEKYFLISGRDILKCEVLGGVHDGGIDIIIDTIDEFGFKDHLMIQTKCRRNTQVTEKELREFLGAFNAKNGTKGIFVTTSTFHYNAKKFLQSLTNCVGIDGHKLFDIAKRTAYGIKRNKDGYFFDEQIFHN